jgi:hypothetical protein
VVPSLPVLSQPLTPVSAIIYTECTARLHLELGPKMPPLHHVTPAAEAAVNMQVQMLRGAQITQEGGPLMA